MSVVHYGNNGKLVYLPSIDDKYKMVGVQPSLRTWQTCCLHLRGATQQSLLLVDDTDSISNTWLDANHQSNIVGLLRGEKFIDLSY